MEKVKNRMSDQRVTVDIWLNGPIGGEVEVADVLRKLDESDVIAFYGEDELLREISEQSLRNHIEQEFPEWLKVLRIKHE